VNAPSRGEVYLVALGSTEGTEIRKTRPCVVVSPDDLNQHLDTFLVIPMTTGGHAYPYRIPCRFRKRAGFVVLNQVRAIDRRRMVRRLGRLAPATMSHVLLGLGTMFAE